MRLAPTLTREHLSRAPPLRELGIVILIQSVKLTQGRRSVFQKEEEIWPHLSPGLNRIRERRLDIRRSHARLNHHGARNRLAAALCPSIGKSRGTPSGLGTTPRFGELLNDEFQNVPIDIERAEQPIRHRQRSANGADTILSTAASTSDITRTPSTQVISCGVMPCLLSIPRLFDGADAFVTQ